MREELKMPEILIAEDNKEIAELEKDYLEVNGFNVSVVANGYEAEKKIDDFIQGKINLDLIILDVMIPLSSGYDLCRQFRSKVDIPILMVTARTESIDVIRGLGLGADDYVKKPFDPAELVARVKNHIERYKRLSKNGLQQFGENSDNNNEYVIKSGNIEIMTKGYKVFKNGVEIKLVNKEFELLKFLATNSDIVFSKEDLFEKIWGLHYTADAATVMVHINRIREKLEDDPKNPILIETVWGAGYRFNKM